MHAAADRGEIDEEVVDEFDRESKGMTLPYSSSHKGAKPSSQRRSKDGKKPYPHKRPS